MSSETSGLELLGALAVGVITFLGTMRSLAERSGMQPNSQERRMMRRFDMRLPAIVRLEGTSEFHT